MSECGYRQRTGFARFAQALAVSLVTAGATPALCPETCSATVDGSSWPCRYHSNDCKVSVANMDPSRLVDINVAVINPYVGGLGDLMTQVEPSVAQAVQDIENSNLLPGYRLNAHLADSKCSVPDATTAAIAAMTTGVEKHVVFSDSCSAACEAVNDALRHFNVLQVGPGCVSVSLSNDDRFPYFARMAPSFRFNVLSIYELLKFFGFHRVGTVYGYRSINNLAKDLFLEMMANDNAAGTYSWTSLFTHRVESIEDAEAAIDLAARKDSRINMMALYELEGSMLLCQGFKKNVLPPDFNWFVASGWWNNNFVTLYADTDKVPCAVDELHRASYSLIAADRGPMLNSAELHSLSGRSLSDLYNEYTGLCEGFANGKGVCNHQWAGYFYDGMWLIASILHSFLIDQNRSLSELGTAQSAQDLYQLSLNIDFMGQTGRVRQFNAVDPTTDPPSYGDRDGIVLLRQVTGSPDAAFVQLAFRTEAGLDFKTDVLWSSTDSSKMLLCSGTSCNFATGWVPTDRANQCEAGRIWLLTEGCQQCSAGSFASLGMTECSLCAAGTFSETDGAVACAPCGLGRYAGTEGASSCILCPEGKYMDQMQATECSSCPIGTYGNMRGMAECTACPEDRRTVFEGASSDAMCVCKTGYYLLNSTCVECDATEICEGGSVIGFRPSNAAWIKTLDVAGAQRAVSQTIAKNFFLIALNIRASDSKASMMAAITKFNNTLFAMMTGDESANIIAAPDQAVMASLEAVRFLWTPFASLLTTNANDMIDGEFVDLVVVAQVAEQTNLLLTASQAVVDAWTDAASTAGATLNGLMVDIAGRQRMLIQRMCKEALIVALGVSIPETRQTLSSVVSLFEETQEGLVFGIPPVGIPQLRSMCTMHQMREVNYYYRQVRPYARSITTAPTNAESSRAALQVASDLSNLTDPFFKSMVEAVKLFTHDAATCNPLETITDSEWLILIDGVAGARIGVAETMRFYMQIALGVVVQESKVELSILIAKETQELVDLVQGQKTQNKPAPPTQEMLDMFIKISNDWSTFAVGLEEAVRQSTIPEVDITLQISLSLGLIKDLYAVMDMVVKAGEASGSEVGLELKDLTRRQKYRFDNTLITAYKVRFGALPAEELNHSIYKFRSLHRDLILGAPATEERMELRTITDLCLVRRMAEVLHYYSHVETASFELLGNGSDVDHAAEIVHHEGHLGLEAMQLAAAAICKFYDGETETCANFTFTKGDWELLMSEVVLLAGLTEDTLTAVIASKVNSEPSSLRDSMDRLVMGSPSPFVPVQPTQAFYTRILNQLLPHVNTFLESLEAPYQTVQDAGTSINTQARSLLQAYTDKALALEPEWPGHRVLLAMWQTVLAKRVYRQATAERFDFGSQVALAERDFEVAHQQLKDGSTGFAAIISEREDLLAQWDRIDAAWQVFKTSKDEINLATLLTEIEASLPLFNIKDVESPAAVPYGFYIAYGVLGLLLVACVCSAVIVARNAMKRQQASNQSAV